MSKLAVAGLCAVAALVALAAAPLRPGPVFAAAAALGVEAALRDAPDPGAAVLALLPAGTVVSIDGPPSDGFYPVTAGNLTGWTPGEALLWEKEVPAGDPDASADAVPVATTADAPVADPAPMDAMAPEPAASGDVAATPLPATATEPVDSVAAEPAPNTSEAPGAFPDAGPTGPATVTNRTPILLGPGPDFGLIAMAPAGSTVEQTGHLIAGYVTVQYDGVTGWASLDRLGPPGWADEAPLVEEPKEQDGRKKERRRS